MRNDPHSTRRRPTTRRHQAGFTLAELVVAIAIIGVLASMAVPSTRRYMGDQEASRMARVVANSFKVARAEALRTGHNQVVFLNIGGATDPGGTPLLDANGRPAAVVILDDGPTGTPGQNCRIDAGETSQAIEADGNLAWGFAVSGGTKAPGDQSPIASGTGSSFVTPMGGASTWVMFRPDGTPVAFDAGCNTGTIGSGNGAVYFTNGSRDLAVVLNALGGSRVHSWNRVTGQWTR